MDEEYTETVRRILQSCRDSFEHLSKQCTNHIEHIDNATKKLEELCPTGYYLKPCPFCGNIPEGVRTNFILYWITCKCCRYEFQDWTSQKSCIDRWNTRYTRETSKPYVEPDDEDEDDDDDGDGGYYLGEF